MLSRLFPLTLIPGFILCGFLVQCYNARIETVRVRYSGAEIEAAKESIAFSLMGQAQLTSHGLIWMKSLEYLHNGVALRMPTKSEEERGFRAHEATDVSTGLAHQDGVPLALNDAMDWRGPVGRLHRTVMPYMEIHQHSDPVELIPWYQLALKLNPNVERLYTLAAFFLADSAREPEQALTLLERGIQKNPWSFEIRAALGRHLFDYHEQLGISPEDAYVRVVPLLQKAIKYGKAEKQQLEEAENEFDEYQEQVFRESYLFLAKSLAALERYEEALKICDEGYATTLHNHLKVQKRIIQKQLDHKV